MKLIFIFLATIIGVAYGQSHTACLGVPDNNFVNNPTSCSSFFHCANGVSSPGTCPPTFLFHPITQYCDFPENVDCTQCSPFGIQNLPDPLSCVRYFMCNGGQSFIMECPPLTYFDRTTGGCVDSSISDCFIDVCPPGPGVSTVPHPESCYSYFVCYNGGASQIDCPGGLRFNPHTSQCDFPHNVICPGDPPGGIPTEPPPGGIPTDPPPGGIPTDPPPGGIPTDPPPGGIPTDPPPPGGIPPPVNCDGRDIYLAHPTDCSRFFMCVGGIPHERQCPGPLLWNPIINMCDSPGNVTC